MMGRLARRNLAAHKLRTVFTMVAVALGVSFVAGTMIFRDTGARSFDALTADLAETDGVTVRAEQTFTSAQAPPRLVPESLLTELDRDVPAAAGLYGLVEGHAAIVLPGGEVVGGGGVAQQGRAYVERPGSPMRITTGRRPAGGGELVVEEHTAAEAGIGTGDQVTVVTPYTTQDMRVVGIFTLGEEWLGELVTYVAFAPEAAGELLLAEPGNYTDIWVRPRPGVSQVELAAQLDAAVPPGYEVRTAADQAAETRERVEDVFALMGQILLGFAGISVLVASFIVFNTFTMVLGQRIRELALLRAVGASRRQLRRAALVEAAGVGLLGSTVGLLAGLGVAVALRLLFARLGAALPAQPPVIQPSTVFWSYTVGIIVTVVAAYVPVRRAARIAPVAALRDAMGLPARSLILRTVFAIGLALLGGLVFLGGLGARGEDGAVLVAAGGVVLFLALVLLGPLLTRPLIKVLGWPVVRFAGAIGQLSRENARRDRRRAAATASALMVGLALVSAATVLTNSVSASVAAEVGRQFSADYALSPRGITGFGPAVVDQVAAVPGVREVAPVQVGSLRVDGDEVSVLVADPAALTGPVSLEVEAGTATLGTDEVLVERALAESRGWQVGTTVAGEYPDQTTVTLRVVGILSDNQVVQQSYLMSPDSYWAHAPETLVQRAYVTLDEGPDQVVRERIQAVLRTHPDVQLVEPRDAADEARQGIDQALNVTLGLLALSIIIAAVGIVNTLSLSVSERTREIGLLRAVGVDRRQIRSMIRYESVIVSLFGAVLGLGLGVGVGVSMQRTMASDGVAVLDLSAEWLGLYLLSAVVIGVAAAIWPAWRAARMDVLEAIRHE